MVLAVVFNEPVTKFGDRQSFPQVRPCRAWVFAAANVGEPVLGDITGLLDCKFTEAPDRRLAAQACIRQIRKHKDLAARRQHLQQEAGRDGVPDLILAVFWFRFVD